MKLLILKKLFSKWTGIFFVFVLIAAFVWFIDKLSGEYHAKFQLKICIYSSTDARTPHLCSDGVLAVSARTSGFRILKQRLFPVLEIDVQHHPVQRTNSGRRFLLVNDIKQALNDEMRIDFVAADTLFFTGGGDGDVLENRRAHNR
ncbi:MAG: hypothetical protein LBI89_02125 [Prevotellaceae bacterium]|jgi:hypothetical protein|nr:hypothetical protein [Prevotellaceae bacterium]